jgi:hypothetical protein
MDAWGDEHGPGGKAMANSWQGEFPFQNLLLDDFEGTATRVAASSTSTGL